MNKNTDKLYQDCAIDGVSLEDKFRSLDFNNPLHILWLYKNFQLLGGEIIDTFIEKLKDIEIQDFNIGCSIVEEIEKQMLYPQMDDEIEFVIEKSGLMLTPVKGKPELEYIFPLLMPVANVCTKQVVDIIAYLYIKTLTPRFDDLFCLFKDKKDFIIELCLLKVKLMRKRQSIQELDLHSITGTENDRRNENRIDRACNGMDENSIRSSKKSIDQNATEETSFGCSNEHLFNEEQSISDYFMSIEDDVSAVEPTKKMMDGSLDAIDEKHVGFIEMYRSNLTDSETNVADEPIEMNVNGAKTERENIFVNTEIKEESSGENNPLLLRKPLSVQERREDEEASQISDIYTKTELATYDVIVGDNPMVGGLTADLAPSYSTTGKDLSGSLTEKHKSYSPLANIHKGISLYDSENTQQISLCMKCIEKQYLEKAKEYLLEFETKSPRFLLDNIALYLNLEYDEELFNLFMKYTQTEFKSHCTRNLSKFIHNGQWLITGKMIDAEHSKIFLPNQRNKTSGLDGCDPYKKRNIEGSSTYFHVDRDAGCPVSKSFVPDKEKHRNLKHHSGRDVREIVQAKPNWDNIFNDFCVDAQSASYVINLDFFDYKTLLREGLLPITPHTFKLYINWTLDILNSLQGSTDYIDIAKNYFPFLYKFRHRCLFLIFYTLLSCKLERISIKVKEMLISNLADISGIFVQYWDSGCGQSRIVSKYFKQSRFVSYHCEKTWGEIKASTSRKASDVCVDYIEVSNKDCCLCSKSQEMSGDKRVIDCISKMQGRNEANSPSDCSTNKTRFSTNKAFATADESTNKSKTIIGNVVEDKDGACDGEKKTCDKNTESVDEYLVHVNEKSKALKVITMGTTHSVDEASIEIPETERKEITEDTTRMENNVSVDDSMNPYHTKANPVGVEEKLSREVENLNIRNATSTERTSSLEPIDSNREKTSHVTDANLCNKTPSAFSGKSNMLILGENLDNKNTGMENDFYQTIKHHGVDALSNESSSDTIGSVETDKESLSPLLKNFDEVDLTLSMESFDKDGLNASKDSLETSTLSDKHTLENKSQLKQTNGSKEEVSEDKCCAAHVKFLEDIYKTIDQHLPHIPNIKTAFQNIIKSFACDKSVRRLLLYQLNCLRYFDEKFKEEIKTALFSNWDLDWRYRQELMYAIFDNNVFEMQDGWLDVFLRDKVFTVRESAKDLTRR